MLQIFKLLYCLFCVFDYQFRADSFSSESFDLALPSDRLSLFVPQEAVGRVCLKERGRDVLVLQRVKSSVTSPSDRPSPTSSGGGSREDDGDKRSALLRRYSSNIKPTHPGFSSLPCHVSCWPLAVTVRFTVRSWGMSVKVLSVSANVCVFQISAQL